MNIDMNRIKAIILVLLFMPLLSVVGGDPVTGEKEQLARLAAVGFGANYRSFDFYTCRYTVTRGKSLTVEAALAGDWQNPVIASCRIVVDGERELNECTGDAPKASHTHTTKSGVKLFTGVFTPFSVMQDGTKALGFTPRMAAVNLYNDRTPPPPTENVTPWSFGTLGPRRAGSWAGPEIMIDRPDDYPLLSASLDNHKGTPVVDIKFSWPKEEGKRLIRLDPSRGYIPVSIDEDIGRYHKHNGLVTKQTYLLDARECEGGRWFPTHWIQIRALNGPNDPYTVTDLRVTDLDVDHRPKSSDFSITIPAGAQVSSMAYLNPQLVFHTKQQESVSLDDIDTLFGMLEASRSSPRMDTAIPTRSRWPLWVRVVAAVGGVITLALLTRFAVRRYRFRT